MPPPEMVTVADLEEVELFALQEKLTLPFPLPLLLPGFSQLEALPGTLTFQLTFADTLTLWLPPLAGKLRLEGETVSAGL